MSKHDEDLLQARNEKLRRDLTKAELEARDYLQAARKMLAALVAVEAAIMNEHGSGADLLPVDSDFDPEHWLVIQQVRAAIAQAEAVEIAIEKETT